VVVSYNATKDVFGIRDPASEFANVLVPAAALDAARTSFGTDEASVCQHSVCDWVHQNMHIICVL